MIRFDYLVILSHSMDDFPVQLFSNRDDALMCALDMDIEDKTREMNAIFCRYASTPSCIKIVDFENGIPSHVEVVREIFFADE